MLAACSTKYEQPVEEVKSVSKNSFKVSEEEAIKRLEEMLNVFDPATRGKKRTIKEIIPRVKPQTRAYAAEIPDTMYYYVNFDDNDGYAIVAADERAIPILALIDTGNYVPPQAYIDRTNAIVDSLDLIYPPEEDDDFWCFQYEATFKTEEMIENLCDGYISSLENSPYTRIFKESTITSQVGPLLKTKWDQVFPYNIRCLSNYKTSYDDCFEEYLLDKAGCVSVAIAQICAYYQHPSSYNGYTYNWDYITTVESLRKTLKNNPNEAGYNEALAISHLIRACGIAADIKFGKDKSGTKFKKAKKAFENYLGYSADRKVGFHGGDIIDELNAARPVFQSAKQNWTERTGHAWVIDGYRKCHIKEIKAAYQDETYLEEVDRRILHESDEFYYHCNFGWGGIANGYYLGKIFDTSQGPIMEEENEGGRTEEDAFDYKYRALFIAPIK